MTNRSHHADVDLLHSCIIMVGNFIFGSIVLFLLFNFDGMLFTLGTIVFILLQTNALWFFLKACKAHVNKHDIELEDDNAFSSALNVTHSIEINVPVEDMVFTLI